MPLDSLVDRGSRILSCSGSLNRQGKKGKDSEENQYPDH